jgi:hypothetical protein
VVDPVKPGLHRQAELPAPGFEFGMQGLQLLAFVDATTVENLLSGHKMHGDDPSSVLYFPAGHATHAVGAEQSHCPWFAMSMVSSINDCHIKLETIAMSESDSALFHAIACANAQSLISVAATPLLIANCAFTASYTLSMTPIAWLFARILFGAFPSAFPQNTSQFNNSEVIPCEDVMKDPP